MNKKKLDIPAPWSAILEPLVREQSFIQLQQFLFDAYQNTVVFPPDAFVLRALALTPPQNVKVLILGQDPYHGPNQANGLCFSVHSSQVIPPSLRNIFKAYCTDLNLMFPPSGDLTHWANQGVLLLNTVLTVAQGQPGSHYNQGWEPFTDGIISYLSKNHKNIVFMLWGSKAQQKKSLIDDQSHLILEAPHPSPLSAHRGFIDCKHFSKANAYLNAHGIHPINWVLG
jgi:uracil-DNA glycosylase